MPKHLAITCDVCGRDITTSGNSVGWRLALVNQEVPSASDLVTDMMVYPILNRDFYFCSQTCLRKWAKGFVSSTEER